MKTIFRVAKTELLILFYSPIAWFLMIVFLIQCGVSYMSALEVITTQQEIGGEGLKYLTDLTSRIFLNNEGLFNSVMENLYLYMPLLTMGLISRETSSGTIKLLYSSPVKVYEIVFGKFLSMMLFSIILMIIVSVFTLSGLFQIKSPETGMLLSGMLGFYLMLCAYSAIGLFMSCLSTYQVVAAIATFLMIGFLSYIGNLWQDVELIRDLTYFLSLNGRVQNMLGGLITTKDVIYFLVIIYIFVGLSVYILKAGRESKPFWVRMGRYMMVIVSALCIGYISSRPGLIGYYDTTANQSRTLTPNAQHIIREMGEEPLEITTYNNLLDRYWFLSTPSSYNQHMALWEGYMRFKIKHNIKLKTVFYYDDPMGDPSLMQNYPGKSLKQIAELFAKTAKVKMKDILTPEQIRKIIDLKPEDNRYVMQLKWKDRTTFLRVFDDPGIWPGETEVAAAFKRLLQTKFPKIAFLTGNLERDVNKMGDRDYKALTNLNTFRYSLVNQGFDVDSLSLETQEIPIDLSMLVLADPKIELTPVTMSKLQQYIDNGGNLLIAADLGRQSILDPLLNKLGVQLMEGMVIQESKDFSPDLVTPEISSFAATFSKILAEKRADSVKISMPGVTGLTFTKNGPFTVNPLLTTDPRLTWMRKQKLDMELFNKASVLTPVIQTSTPLPATDTKSRSAGTVTFAAADGDVMGPVTTALALTRNIRGREQRIVVTADADFLSNSELNRFNIQIANYAFSTGVFSWLSYKEFPIDTSRPPAKDNGVNVTLDQVEWLRILYVWILPALLLAFAALLLIRRKRK